MALNADGQHTFTGKKVIHSTIVVSAGESEMELLLLWLGGHRSPFPSITDAACGDAATAR